VSISVQFSGKWVILSRHFRPKADYRTPKLLKMSLKAKIMHKKTNNRQTDRCD